MHDAEGPTLLSKNGQADSKFCLNVVEDDETYEKIVDEILRQGVQLTEEEFLALLQEIQEGSKAWNRQTDISAMVQVALDKVKYKDHPVPIKAVANVEIPRKPHSVHHVAPKPDPVVPTPAPTPRDRILRKLGWADDAASRKKLSQLLDRMEEAGVEDPEVSYTVKDAADRSGVAERTLRRYIAEGRLPTEKVKGSRGIEHRIYAPWLFTLVHERTTVLDQARSNPVESMGREIASLCRVIVDQQALADRRTDRLLDEIRHQSRVIDELRAEQRDARAQMHTLQEQMIKALMPRQKSSIWERVFSKN